MSQGADFALIDAFVTQGSFSGNPACVVLDDPSLDDRHRQALAAEFRQAETAFVSRRNAGEYGLRWFTPTVEVDLCGHATLAAGHFLAESGIPGPYQFHTRSGVLACSPADRGLELDFPALKVTPAEHPAVREMFPDARFIGTSVMDWFVEVGESAVREFQPDFEALARLGLRGLILCSESEHYDVVSRFFAPQSGVPEDAVTGSAHCALAPYFAQRYGRLDLKGFQASSRSGEVEMTLVGDRVKLRGGCRTVVQGRVLVQAPRML